MDHEDGLSLPTTYFSDSLLDIVITNVIPRTSSQITNVRAEFATRVAYRRKFCKLTQYFEKRDTRSGILCTTSLSSSR